MVRFFFFGVSVFSFFSFLFCVPLLDVASRLGTRVAAGQACAHAHTLGGSAGGARTPPLVADAPSTNGITHAPARGRRPTSASPTNGRVPCG